MELLLAVKRVFFSFLFVSLLHADFEYSVQNSNFILSDNSSVSENKKHYFYNYERLRFHGDFTEDYLFATLISDGVNYYSKEYINSLDFNVIKEQYSDTPLKTQSGFSNYAGGRAYVKLYRAYAGYEDSKNRVVVGLQNIPMGVGRIWRPTNLFNPYNSFVLEPDETYAIFGLSYTYYIGDMGQMNIIASQRADQSYKYAIQYKSYLDFADVGVEFLHSNHTTMLGYEIEGNLGKSGVEFRSECAYIKSRDDKLGSLYQGIIGVDYAFVNSMTVTVEALLSSKIYGQNQILEYYNSEVYSNLLTSHFYSAFKIDYNYTIYLSASLLYIDSFKNEGSFLSPTLTYILNDYNSFSIGTQLQQEQKRYYLNWELSF